MLVDVASVEIRRVRDASVFRSCRRWSRRCKPERVRTAKESLTRRQSGTGPPQHDRYARVHDDHEYERQHVPQHEVHRHVRFHVELAHLVAEVDTR